MVLQCEDVQSMEIVYEDSTAGNIDKSDTENDTDQIEQSLTVDHSCDKTNRTIYPCTSESKNSTKSRTSQDDVDKDLEISEHLLSNITTSANEVETIKDINDLEKNENSVQTKPWIDRGWAWMVAAGGFFVMFAALGSMRCLGLIFAEIQDEYEGSTTLVAIMPSVIYLLNPVMSPISSALTARFGSRPIVAAGTLIAVFAHTTFMFTTDITQMLLFFSIPFGIGIGLAYVPTFIIVGKYFDKYAALGNGITTCGSAVSGIVTPMLFTYLLDQYGLKGAILLTGGVMTNVLVGVSLFRPLEFWEKPENKKKAMTVLETSDSGLGTNDEIIMLDEMEETCNNTGNLLTPYRKEHAQRINRSEIHLPNVEHSSHPQNFTTLHRTFLSEQHINVENSSFRKQNLYQRFLSAREPYAHRCEKRTLSCHKSHQYGRFLSTMEATISPSGSVVVLGERVTANQNEIEDLLSQEMKMETDEKNITSRVGCFSSFCSMFNKIFNWSHLKYYPFLVQLVVSCNAYCGYMMAMTYLPSYAIDNNIEKHRAYFLVTIGALVDLPGRFLLAVVADQWSAKSFGRKYHVMAVSLMICGIAVIIMAFLNSYTALAVCIGFLSFFGGGGFVGLNPPVLKEVIGLDRFSHGGLGLIIFFTAFTNGGAPPLVGLLRDTLGSYKVPYIINGCMLLFGGIFAFLHPMAQRMQEKKMNTLTN